MRRHKVWQMWASHQTIIHRQAIDYQDLAFAARHGFFLIESHQNLLVPSVVVETSLNPWRSYQLYGAMSFSRV